MYVIVCLFYIIEDLLFAVLKVWLFVVGPTYPFPFFTLSFVLLYISIPVITAD